MAQTIAVSVGEAEYSYPLTITETTGKDISDTTIQLSLGTLQTPGVWMAPDNDTPQSTKSKRIVELLINSSKNLPKGEYYLWSKVEDTPEVFVTRHDRIIIT